MILLWRTESLKTSFFLFGEIDEKKEIIGTCKRILRDALRDLVPFLQFKKREKNPWRSVTLIKVAGF